MKVDTVARITTLVLGTASCARFHVRIAEMDGAVEVLDVSSAVEGHARGGPSESGVHDKSMTPDVFDVEVSARGDASTGIDLAVVDVVRSDATAVRWTVPPGRSPVDPAVAVIRDSLGGGACILTASGAVWCWGDSHPGNASTPPVYAPRRLVGLPAIRQLAVEGVVVRALSRDGTLWDWMWGDCLRACASCRDGAPYILPTPLPVRSLTRRLWAVFEDGSCRATPLPHQQTGCSWREWWRQGVVAVDETANYRTTCATMSSGHVECFVDPDASAELPQHMFHTFGTTPSEYPGLSDVASFVFIHSGTQCALLRSGEVRCWGVSDCAQAGSADGLENCTDDPFRFFYCYRTPRPVPGITDAVQIRPWASGACVIRRDGTVWCWGRLPRGTWGIFDGQYGLERDPGNTVCLRGPAPIQGLRDVVDLALGGGWCAVIRDGRVFCYGGTPGDGTDGSQGDPWPPREVRWGP